MKKSRTRKEFDVQKEVCAFIADTYPHIVFFSDLSGVRLPIGLARKIKELKGRRGIPDIFIAYPSHGLHGLFLELKKEGTVIYKKDGTLRKDSHLEEQEYILNVLSNIGYRAEFAIGTMDAITRILSYIEGDQPS